MPFTPYTRRPDDDQDNQEDEEASESGLVSESGIYTYDGTVASQSPVKLTLEDNRLAQGLVLDDSLDYESLVSGVEDASFLMNESILSYPRAYTTTTATTTGRAREQQENRDHAAQLSLDDGSSSLDLEIYAMGAYPYNNKSKKKTSPVANTHPTAEESIFGGAYTRVMKSFLFPSAADPHRTTPKAQKSDEKTGKATPKTLTPREASYVDDDDLHESTLIVGKVPQTPRCAAAPHSSSDTTMPVYPETRILGLRLSRLICLIVLVLVAAVAVAVGAALVLQEDDEAAAASPDTSRVEDGGFPTPSPVVMTVPDPTESVNDGNDDMATDGEEDGSVTDGDADGDDGDIMVETSTSAPTVVTTSQPTRRPVTGTRSPTIAGPTAAPSSAGPTGLPTAWSSQIPTASPVIGCGTDDDETTFVLFNEDRNCVWFRQTNPSFREFFCSEEYEPFWICSQTCNNCLSAPTASPNIETVPTSPPTGRPVTAGNIEETILAAAPPSTASNLQDGNDTPQRRALDFLLREDEAVEALPAWRIRQLFAMATLAYAANLAGGGGQRWLDTYDECEYWGVTCDDQGAVAQIDISGRNRGGTLPDEIIMLPSLVIFDGAIHGFSGIITPAFGLLPNLVALRLEQNDLTGNLPSSFADSRSLRDLFLHRNQLSGEFPNAILGQMSALQAFSIFGNDFTGDIQGDVCDLGLRTFTVDCANVPTESSCDSITQCVN